MVVAAVSQAGGPSVTLSKVLAAGLVRIFVGRRRTDVRAVLDFLLALAAACAGVGLVGIGSRIASFVHDFLLLILLVAGPAGSGGAPRRAWILKRRLAIRFGLFIAVIGELPLSRSDILALAVKRIA